MVRRRRPPAGGKGRYPRSARVNHLLQEVLADELERLDREDLGLVTVTGVESDPEIRHATVYVDSLTDEQAAVLEELRPRLQRAINDQVRLRRTPELAFVADPAIAAGERVDELLRGSGEDERPV